MFRLSLRLEQLYCLVQLIRLGFATGLLLALVQKKLKRVLQMQLFCSTNNEFENALIDESSYLLFIQWFLASLLWIYTFFHKWGTNCTQMLDSEMLINNLRAGAGSLCSHLHYICRPLDAGRYSWSPVATTELLLVFILVTSYVRELAS